MKAASIAAPLPRQQSGQHVVMHRDPLRIVIPPVPDRVVAVPMPRTVLNEAALDANVGEISQRVLDRAPRHARRLLQRTQVVSSPGDDPRQVQLSAIGSAL